MLGSMSNIKQDLRDGMEEALSDLRTLRDEVRLKLHLAGMDAKDAFHKLEPRLSEVEREIAKGGDSVAGAVRGTVDELRASFRRLRDELKG